MPAPSGVRCRLGVARDQAFHFYYAENLRLLEAAGAELVSFSPLHDTKLPDVDGLYLGGGYPELFAAELSANHGMRAAVLDFAGRGGPIYAECGGLMYLTRTIVTLDGGEHAMVGLLPALARMRDGLQAIGYVEVSTVSDGILGAAGARFRGHQFRYSELEPVLDAAPGAPAYALRRHPDEAATLDGYRVGNCLASYVHAHWASNPQLATALVESCVRFRVHVESTS
jgi:cobyrinic acid a,c-diamide synthase